MSNTMNKIIEYIKDPVYIILIMGLGGIIFFFYLVMSSISNFVEKTIKDLPEEKLLELDKTMVSMENVIIIISIAVIIISIIYFYREHKKNKEVISKK